MNAVFVEPSVQMSPDHSAETAPMKVEWSVHHSHGSTTRDFPEFPCPEKLDAFRGTILDYGPCNWVIVHVNIARRVRAQLQEHSADWICMPAGDRLSAVFQRILVKLRLAVVAAEIEALPLELALVRAVFLDFHSAYYIKCHNGERFASYLISV
jgi:fatty-acid desaturase